MKKPSASSARGGAGGMRLGFFSTEYLRKRPGMAESDRELCHELARIGYDVRAVVEDRSVARGSVVVGNDGPVLLWRYQAPRFQVLRPRTYADKLVKTVLGSPRVASLLAIYGRFVRENPDVDLLQAEMPFPHGALVGMVARRNKKPFVVSARGWESLRMPWLRLRTIGWTLRRATGVRPNSPFMEKLAVENFGVDPGRVRVIPTNLSRESCLPSGTDVREYRRASRAMLRSQTGFTHTFLLATMSRLVPGKGIDDLVVALRQLKDLGVDAGLILCGDGVLRATLQTAVGELGLARDVHFAGWIPHGDTRSVLAAADLLLVPSLVDSAPRVAIEAAAVGTPSVLTSGVGCASWMAEAGIGRVVPAGAPARLAEAIRDFLADPASLANAGREAVAWAGGFTVERVAEKMSRFHREVVDAYRLGIRPENATLDKRRSA